MLICIRGIRPRLPLVARSPVNAYAANQAGDKYFSTQRSTPSGLCRPKFQEQYGQYTFGDFDGAVITFPEGVTTRPFQRILLYCAAQSVLLRENRGDLSRDFQVSRVLLQPISPFGEEEKQRIEDWVLQSMPEDCIVD